MSEKIFQLKIETKRIKPNIWRRILIKQTSSLQNLHEAIMILFGFDDCHLYEFFEIGEHVDCAEISLSKSFEFYKILNYIYDFGDYWEFKITLEKSLEQDVSLTYPHCIKSKGGMMLEDCGGEYGYIIITDWCRNKTKSAKKVLIDYYGDPEALDQYADFDPDAFDINESNAELATLK